MLVSLICLVAVALLPVPSAHAQKRVPRRYGDAVTIREVNPEVASTRKRIELYHNYFRAKVEPPASNMLQMSWSEAAAEDARRWAEACELLVHDNATGRWVDDYGSCGQNIFVANFRVPWLFAIETWFLERLNFTFGADDNDLGVVGHYTQLVWFSSHQVGCGFHHCADAKPKPFYNYVCNYCPIGNFPLRIGRPYQQGTPCGDCSAPCKFRKLCTNACHYADLWMNCGRLRSRWRHWLCDSGSNEAHCLATCRCMSDTIN